MKGNDFVEEILNTLIAIDDECKSALNVLHEKKENIEYLVDAELSKRKDEIKTRYKFKIDMRKNEYDMKLNEYQKKIDEEKSRKIDEIRTEYLSHKKEIINNMIQSIIKK